MHADLVLLAAIREARVEDEEVFVEAGIEVRGVVARRHIAFGGSRFAGGQRELKIPHELLSMRCDARVVEQHGGIAAHGVHVRARGVEVGSVGRL